MKKYAVLFLLIIMFLQSSSLSTGPDINSSDTLPLFESPPLCLLSDKINKDSFGLPSRGSLSVNKELSQAEQQKQIITLADVCGGLKLYGLFPESEALINSILWKINSKITVQFQDHQYVLILREVKDQSIRVGWLENESVHDISLPLPATGTISEQQEESEMDRSESILFLDTPPRPNSTPPHEKKR